MNSDPRPVDGIDPRKAYWKANKALIRNLLIVWALVSLVMSILLVEPLNNFQLGGVPFGFWMAQQGSIYVFVILIFTYAIQMDKLEKKYGRPQARPTTRPIDPTNQPPL